MTCKECERLNREKIAARRAGDMSKVADLVILIAQHMGTH